MKAAVLGLLFVSLPAFGTEYRPVVSNIYVTNNTYSDTQAVGMAMSAIDFDSNTKSVQLGIGGAVYEDQYGTKASSLAFGVGQRVCEDSSSCGLLKITGGFNEGGGKGAAVGFVWKL